MLSDLMNKINYTEVIIPKQKPEKFYGNKEYKRLLMPRGSPIQKMNNIKKKASQMLFRLLEGDGKALYILGIEDNGDIYGLNKKELDHTLINFYNIVKEINAKIKIIRIYKGYNKDINKIGYVCAARIFLPKEILNNKKESINGF